MLRISHLSYGRNEEAALFENLNLDLNYGQGLVVYGDNGSGKTSLLRVLAGLLLASTGTVEKPEDFHYLGHQPGLKSYLSVEENLAYSQGLASTEALSPELIEQSLAAVGLLALRQQSAGALSAGQKRRLALARLLVTPKKLWLMDEPFSNLDQEGQAWLWRLVQDHLQQGGMVVLSSHQALSLEAQPLFKSLHLGALTNV